MRKRHLIWIIPLGLLLLGRLAVSVLDISLVSTDLVIEAAVPPAARVAHQTDYWEAVFSQELGYDRVDRPAGGERDRLVEGLSAFLDNDYRAAERIARELLETATEERVRLRARDLLLHVCLGENRWSDFLAIAPDRAAMAAGDTTRVACPDGLALAEGFARGGEEIWRWPDGPLVLPLDTNIAGHALIEVEVCGRARRFLIDTGANMSVITTSLAGEIGLAVPAGNLPRVGTSTTATVGAAPVSLPELRIGELTIENHRAYCVAGESLEFKILLFTLVELDGIIGWNAIRRMELELDFPDGVARIRRPGAPVPPERRTVRWAGDSQPLVRGLAADGTELWFFLDTGANMSSLHGDILRKLDLEISGPRQTYAMGAGGAEVMVSGRVADFPLHIGRHRFTFPSLSVHTDDRGNRNDAGELEWFSSDGVLGIDAAGGGRLLLDATAGRFEVRPLLSDG